jgi:hypothetical protein
VSEHKTARPADPEWWEDYNARIPELGPRVWFHGTSLPRAQRILMEGLKPHDHEDVDHDNYSNPFESDERDWLTPRPGHTYLTDDLINARSYANSARNQDDPDYYDGRGHAPPGAILKIDPTYLDPKLVNPDEDALGFRTPDEWLDAEYEKHGDGEYMHPDSLGQHAEDIGWGDDPQDTKDAIKANRTFAYRGVIPPEAITLHRVQSDAPGAPVTDFAPPAPGDIPQGAPGHVQQPITSRKNYARIVGEKLAGRSQLEWQRLQDGLNAKYGPSQSEVIHTSPDGWTVQQHHTPEDVMRVGEMMANCWQNRERYGKTGPYFTLHDPMGRPKLAVDEQAGKLSIPLGAFNAFPFDHAGWSGPTRLKGYVNRLAQGLAPLGYDSWNGYANAASSAPWVSTYGFPNRQARTAGETANQEARRWADIQARMPGRSEVVHQFPDGWNVQRHSTYGDVIGVGKMMQNCYNGDWPLDQWAEPYQHMAGVDPITKYWHAAPTEDRARIQAHGLIQGTPRWSPNWYDDDKPPTGNVLRNQPTGVYLSTRPDRFPSSGRPYDLWSVNPEHVDMNQTFPDKLGHEGNFRVTHDIAPEALTLERPFEHHDAVNDLWPKRSSLPQHVYRTMSEDHFQQSLRDGYHQSDERGNYIGQAADNPEYWEGVTPEPEGTVAGYWPQPGYLLNSPNGIGRVVRIRVQPEDGWEVHPDESEYMRTFKPIPADRFEAWTKPMNVRQPMDWGEFAYRESTSSTLSSSQVDSGFAPASYRQARTSKLTEVDTRTVTSNDYWMNHRPPGPDGAEEGTAWQLHELDKGISPGPKGGLYENPHWVRTGDNEYDAQSIRAAWAARGNPNALVTIHRASPSPQISPGDWVTLSHGYAQRHGYHYNDPTQDMPVHSAQVPAHTLWWNGDSINEFGYHGPVIEGQQHTSKTASPELEHCDTCGKPILIDHREHDLSSCLLCKKSNERCSCTDDDWCGCPENNQHWWSHVASQRFSMSMTQHTGFPELDKAIEEFIATHSGPPLYLNDFRSPSGAWGACEEAADAFAAFLKQRGFRAYATADELTMFPGYEDAQDSKAIGAGDFSYPEHAVVEVYGLYGENDVRTITIDFTAAQYGYTEFPKVEPPYQARTAASDQIPSLDELAPYRYDQECHDYAPMVEHKWPHLKQESGYYNHPTRGPGDHSWNIAPDGTIIDTTAAQHGYTDEQLDQRPITPLPQSQHPEIIPPSHPLYPRYISYGRHWPGIVGIAAAHDYEMPLPEYMEYNGIDADPAEVERHYQQIMGQPMPKPEPMWDEEFKTDDPWGKTSASVNVMYHVAPSSARESISTNGIDITKGKSGTDYAYLGNEPGNYFWHDLADAQRDHQRQTLSTGEPWDIWQAHIGGHEMQPSVNSYCDDSESYTTRPVSPDRITRVAHPDQRKTQASVRESGAQVQGEWDEVGLGMWAQVPQPPTPTIARVRVTPTRHSTSPSTYTIQPWTEGREGKGIYDPSTNSLHTWLTPWSWEGQAPDHYTYSRMMGVSGPKFFIGPDGSLTTLTPRLMDKLAPHIPAITQLDGRLRMDEDDGGEFEGRVADNRKRFKGDGTVWEKAGTLAPNGQRQSRTRPPSPPVRQSGTPAGSPPGGTPFAPENVCPQCGAGHIVNLDQSLAPGAQWGCDTCGFRLNTDSPDVGGWSFADSTGGLYPGAHMPFIRHEPGSEWDGRFYRNPKADQTRPAVRGGDPRQQMPGFLPQDYPVRQGSKGPEGSPRPGTPKLGSQIRYRRTRPVTARSHSGQNRSDVTERSQLRSVSRDPTVEPVGDLLVGPALGVVVGDDRGVRDADQPERILVKGQAVDPTDQTAAGVRRQEVMAGALHRAAQAPPASAGARHSHDMVAGVDGVDSPGPGERVVKDLPGPDQDVDGGWVHLAQSLSESVHDGVVAEAVVGVGRELAEGVSAHVSVDRVAQSPEHLFEDRLSGIHQVGAANAERDVRLQPERAPKAPADGTRGLVAHPGSVLGVSVAALSPSALVGKTLVDGLEDLSGSRVNGGSFSSGHRSASFHGEVAGLVENLHESVVVGGVVEARGSTDGDAWTSLDAADTDGLLQDDGGFLVGRVVGDWEDQPCAFEAPADSPFVNRSAGCARTSFGVGASGPVGRVAQQGDDGLEVGNGVGDGGALHDPMLPQIDGWQWSPGGRYGWQATTPQGSFQMGMVPQGNDRYVAGFQAFPEGGGMGTQALDGLRHQMDQTGGTLSLHSRNPFFDKFPWLSKREGVDGAAHYYTYSGGNPDLPGQQGVLARHDALDPAWKVVLPVSVGRQGGVGRVDAAQQEQADDAAFLAGPGQRHVVEVAVNAAERNRPRSIAAVWEDVDDVHSAPLPGDQRNRDPDHHTSSSEPLPELQVEDPTHHTENHVDQRNGGSEDQVRANYRVHSTLVSALPGVDHQVQEDRREHVAEDGRADVVVEELRGEPAPERDDQQADPEGERLSNWTAHSEPLPHHERREGQRHRTQDADWQDAGRYQSNAQFVGREREQEPAHGELWAEHQTPRATRTTATTMATERQANVHHWAGSGRVASAQARRPVRSRAADARSTERLMELATRRTRSTESPLNEPMQAHGQVSVDAGIHHRERVTARGAVPEVERGVLREGVVRVEEPRQEVGPTRPFLAVVDDAGERTHLVDARHDLVVQAGEQPVEAAEHVSAPRIAAQRGRPGEDAGHHGQESRQSVRPHGASLSVNRTGGRDVHPAISGESTPNPLKRLWRWLTNRALCEACGDPLERGQCKRCDWGGWSTAEDAIKNPSDPTVDMHRGIQASSKPFSRRETFERVIPQDRWWMGSSGPEDGPQAP